MANRNGGFIGTDGLDAPDPPTGVTASGGADGTASISFTAPTDTGTSAITGFVATASNGVGATGTSSPISVSSLTLGTAITFRAYAINAYGTSAASDATSSITPAASRGLFMGENPASGILNVIQFVSISSTGNAQDFGDLTVARALGAACGSSTRSVKAGGEGTDGSVVDVMDYVNPASAGNASDFGNLEAATKFLGGFSNSTRGVFGGGKTGSANHINTMQYITIANTGNTTDFGNLSATRNGAGGLASTTRGVFGGGNTNTFEAGQVNIMEYITIANTGNTTDFGNLAANNSNIAGASNSTRGLFLGGHESDHIDRVQYITIASTGDTTDFGNLVRTQYNGAATSNSTRAIYGGGEAGGFTNAIQYFTIANTGNTTDFGDLLVASARMSATSNAHGGL